MIQGRSPLGCLCTSVGNEGFVSVYSALKAFYKDSIKVIGCDIRPDAYGLYLADKGYVVPQRDNPDFAEKLIAIAQRETCSVIYPLSTFDQEYFAAHRTFFEENGICVVVSDLPSVSIANDKLKLYELFNQSRSIHVAGYQPAHDRSSLQGGLKKLGYPSKPVVFKLRHSTAARGLFIVREKASVFESIHRHSAPPEVSFEELPSILAHLHDSNGVLCEYLPGEEYSVDVLSLKGEPIVSVVRKRYSSVGGLATHAEVVEDVAMQGMAESVVRTIGLSYTSNVQFRKNSAGIPCLMEVNPRIPGTVGLTVEAGVNMPAFALELALGRPIPQEFIINYGMRVLRHWGSLYHRGRLLKKED
jgi:carbamoyl-phosphate synthase large subunit